MEADVVYIAASGHDARLARICVASIRSFYPSVPIRILPGGRLPGHLVRELRRYWDVELAAIPPGDYGWGFVKLEPLFDPSARRFLVLDSDTALSGPVLDTWLASSAPFLVDREVQSDSDMRRLYYDWDQLARIDPAARRPDFVFNSGQWFGTSGILTRAEFDPWVEWTMPRRLRYPAYFMPGDQGVLNYVLNQKAASGELVVDRQALMLWPGHGMEEFDARSIAAKDCPARVIHWAGMKRTLLHRMVGSDVLEYFESRYYQNRFGGSLMRHADKVRHLLSHVNRAVSVRLKLAYKKRFGRTRSRGSQSA